MNIYRIATPPVVQSETNAITHVRFATSNKGARAAKKELVEATGVKPSTIEVTEIDVPKGKGGLISYLNGFHTQVPGDYTPPGYPKGAVKKKGAKKKK